MAQSWADTINDRNQAIWATRNQEMRQRLTHPLLAERAFKLIRDEESRKVPLGKRRSLEGLLQQAGLELRLLVMSTECPVVLTVVGKTQRDLAVHSGEATPPSELPCPSDISLEAALRSLAQERGRRGGSAKKADALTRSIRSCLEADPTLSQRKIFYLLLRTRGTVQFTKVDRETIEWHDAHGLVRRVKIKNLKDRIYRLRKDIISAKSKRNNKRPVLNARTLRLLNSDSRQAA